MPLQPWQRVLMVHQSTLASVVSGKLECYCSRIFCLSKCLLRNQLLFQWVFLYMSLVTFLLQLQHSFFVLYIYCLNYDMLWIVPFLILSIWCSVCFLSEWVCISLVWKNFFCNVQNLVYAISLVFSFFYDYDSNIWSFIEFHSSYMFLLCDL